MPTIQFPYDFRTAEERAQDLQRETDREIHDAGDCGENCEICAAALELGEESLGG